jgi:hypothetical protein
MMATGFAKGVGEREVQKYLTAALRHGFFPTWPSVDILSDSHIEVSYGSKSFTFEGRQEEELVEWTQKVMVDVIAWNLSHHLESQNICSTSVVHVNVVASGDHGDVAFQFGASVHVEMSDRHRIHFEVSAIELICRKDTTQLIEATIRKALPQVSRKWHY